MSVGMDEVQAKEQFAARDYQVQLLSIALNENTILYLPTGSGKTFIAVLLIKCMSGDLEMPYKKGGKRIFFAVNTVALVKQQGDYIARHTHLKVGKYSGDMNVDGWSQERWEAELIENQVIVLTCQILLNLLQHGFIRLVDINLIIFDECHHAVADHCMRRVMQKFESCPPEAQPRVLGLSATLLNSNCKSEKVDDELKNLERTFLSKIATVDDVKIIEQFSASPEECICDFKKGYPCNSASEIPMLLSTILDKIKTAKCILESLGPGHFADENKEYSPSESLKILNKSDDKRVKKKLISILVDVEVMFEDLGIMGGYFATLYGMIALHQKRLKVSTDMGKLIVSACITNLILIRKIISKELDKYSPSEQITRFSSNKLLLLLDEVKKNESKVKISQKEKMDFKTKALAKASLTLIFVERRQTARTLYHLLKHAATCIPGLGSVVPDFVVGVSANPISQESTWQKKKIDDSVKRFRIGETNYLVASDVLEEGVDIPMCDLVIKFDLPKTFRSYIQSKGRARHSISEFKIFVSEDDFGRLKNKLTEFQKVESTLKQILIGKSDARSMPSEEELRNSTFEKDIPPYYSNDRSASVDATSSIPLIYRYCSRLPQDKFTSLNPVWLLDENHIERSEKFGFSVMKKVAYLKLPINSPLKHFVKGIPMVNQHLARRAVALIACVILHRMGELGENDLFPVTHTPKIFKDRSLLPHWKDESADRGVPGSKKRSQSYSKQVAKILKNCHPQPGKISYIHHISQYPMYDRPPEKDSRGNAIYDVLCMDRGYAIITSKKIPKLCNFSIYMRSGEVGVKIGDDKIDELILTSDQISELEDFNYMLFFNLLKIEKQFVVSDKNYEENSYLIAPTLRDETGKWVIDWEISQNYPILPDVYPISEDDARKLVVDKENFLHEVVTPWYRGEYTEKNYIVSKICKDMSAQSDFPSGQYDSYESYFEGKYNLKLIRPELPLLEVKAISDHILCIHPRGVTNTVDDTPPLSKRQMMLKLGDFNEHLIPELVTKRLFPATLWLKATALPTILHRMSFLLIAHELRHQICIETNLGIGPPEGNQWKPLKYESSLELDTESKDAKPVPPEFFSSGDNVHKDHSELIHIDLDRAAEELSILDIIQYHKLETEMNNPEIVKDDQWLPIEPASVPQIVLERLCDNQSSGTCLGPELADVLCALTSNSSNDAINLERLETLGDSFLKFTVSTFLFLKFPEIDEGKLTSIKGRMISNRNLLYCAQNKSLGEKLKFHSFAPVNDWHPPGFVVPTFLKEKLKNHEGIPNNLLYKLIIPEADRRTGTLSRDTKEDIIILLEEGISNNIMGKMSSTLENLLGIQNIPDKSLADSVEALIGAWLLTGGFTAAFRLLGWFGILPHGPNGPGERWEDIIDEEIIQSASSKTINNQENIKIIGGVIDWGPQYKPNESIESFEKITMTEAPSILLDGSREFNSVKSLLPNAAAIEKLINYQFKNRLLLLQAFTHASFHFNQITECYQRLEFLGDAVLDYIITCHIYETCGNLSPGQLTDLRSALVNNITFASLAVRHGLHRNLLHLSKNLMDNIDSFVTFQIQRNHDATEECLNLMFEDECNLSESVEVPKALGDIIESLAGAIFLDSGLSVSTVWRVFYPIMKKEIDSFSKNVPKQPVRKLLESDALVYFLPSVIVESEETSGSLSANASTENTVMVPLEVREKGSGKTRTFYGFGPRKSLAKRAAAKQALRAMAKS